VLWLEVGALRNGGEPRVGVNGSRKCVGVVSWAFRVGLNQMAGSLLVGQLRLARICYLANSVV
jgi:hypothetical protein